MKIAGVILAGGKSIRMGRDKATMIRHASPEAPLPQRQTWLERQLNLLESCAFEPRAVSWNQEQPPPDLPRGVQLIRDRTKNAGPLAGLEAVLTVLPTALVFILAVDLQRMSHPLISQLLARARPGYGVIPMINGEAEPLAAIYPATALAEVVQRLHRGELSMRGLVQAGITQGWLIPWTVPDFSVDDFANWNHPADPDC